MAKLLLILVTSSIALAQGFAPESIGNMIYNNIPTSLTGSGNLPEASSGIYSSTGVAYQINSKGAPLSSFAQYSYRKTSENAATLVEKMGSSESTLVITFTGPSVGNYMRTFSSSFTYIQGSISFALIPNTDAIRPEVPLTNISARATLAVGQVLNPGFTVSGTVSRRVLIRAIGPTLASFGVTGAAQSPTLAVFQGPSEVATNSGWGGSSVMSEVFSSVGAFPLPSTSRDAAVVISVRPGNYTVVVTGPGEVLAEIYFIE